MRIRLALSSIVAMACSNAPASSTTPTPMAPAGIATAAPSSAASAARAKRFPIADFDGDGLADLAFTAVEQPGYQCQPSGNPCWRPNTPSRMTLLVFLGRDRGALTQTIELATGRDELSMGRAYEVGAVGDLDGDGRTEIAITFDPYGGGAEALLLLRGTTSGLSEPYQTVTLPILESGYWYSVRARAAGDVDGDGHPDVLLGPAILHGGAGGKVRDVELVRPPGYTKYEHVMAFPVGDVTGDVRADVVAVMKQKAYLLPGGKAAPVPLAMTAAYPAFEAADLDGDGKSELISITPGSRRLRVSTFTLSAAGAAPDQTIDIPGDEVHGVVAADTDGSGVRDLHVIASIGRVDVPCGSKCTGPANVHVRTVRGGAKLTLDPRPPSPPSFSLGGPHIYLRALGDLDGDGIEELGVVAGGKLRATRSRGGTFELDARYRSTPVEIAVYTGPAS